MVVPIRKQMDDLDKRLDEMHKSIELIARHVKHELDETKKKSPAYDIAELKKQTEKIATLEENATTIAKQMKEEMEALKTQVKEAQMKQLLDFKKMQSEYTEAGLEKELSEKLNDEIAKLKDFVSEFHASISQEVDAQISGEIAKLENFLAKSTDKMEKLEDDFGTAERRVKESMESIRRELKDMQMRQFMELKKSQPRDDSTTEKRLNEEIERIEGFINDTNRVISDKMEKKLNEETGRLETFISDSNKIIAEDIEQKLQQETARLEDLIYNSGRLLTEKGMEEYLTKISKLKTNLERYVNVKTQLLDTRINEMSESVKNLEVSKDFLEIDEKIAALETKLSADMGEMKRAVRALGSEDEIHAIKRKMDKFASEQEIEEHKGNVAGLMQSMKKLAPESEVIGIEQAVEKFRKNMDEIKQSLTTLVPESEIIGPQSAIKSLRKKLDVFETAEEFQKFKEEMSKHLRAEDAAIADTRDRLEENMKSLTLDFTRRINEMKKLVDEEAARFKDFVNEKELQEIRNELEELRRAADDKDADRMSLDKRLGDLEYMTKDMNASEEINSIKQGLENETANRLSLEKNLSDMEKIVTEMKEKYAGVQNLEHMDFEQVEQEITAFRESLRSAEREMHLKVMDVITQQLNEFAKTLDKRIPDIMTKDEFARSLAEIKTRLQHVKAPDLTPLALRVEQLEREVANISNMMHSMYNRVPIVVE